MNTILNFFEKNTLEECKKIIQNNVNELLFYNNGKYTNEEPEINTANAIKLSDLNNALDAINIFNDLGGLTEVKNRIRMAYVLRVMDVDGYDIRQLQEWVDILEGSNIW